MPCGNDKAFAKHELDNKNGFDRNISSVVVAYYSEYYEMYPEKYTGGVPLVLNPGETVLDLADEGWDNLTRSLLSDPV